MGCNACVIAEEGLLFFGKMSASISHELKNLLAIINENAGLLEDFTAMAARGIALDGDRLQRLASDVKRQVDRSDEILRSMNRFAHTIDKPLDRVDIADFLQLGCTLAQRLAAMHALRLEVIAPPEPIVIETAPFQLLNIIWCCIDFMVGRQTAKGVIRLGVNASERRIRIAISASTAILDFDLDAVMPPEHRKVLLGSIGADLAMDDDRQTLVLGLPLAQGP